VTSLVAHELEADSPHDRIGRAAMELMAEAGWEGVTARGVAARANFPPALVRSHYGSGAALRRATALRALATVFEPVLVALLVAPVDRALELAVEAVDSGDSENCAVAAVLEATLQAQRDPELREQLLDMRRELQELLERRLASGARAGILRQDLDARGAALFIAAALAGIGLQRALDPDTSLQPGAAAIVAALRA
jgi:AcrR family transcriptional regulator